MSEDILALSQRLKRRETTPKVYSVLLTSEAGPVTQESLWMGVAYSLEEAYLTAKRVAKLDGSVRMKYWSIRTIQELFERHTESEYTPIKSELPPEQETKNELMARILEGGGASLYKKVKGELSETEQTFIEQSLKKI